ncbi:MAG: NADH-quinone oxidoreductase subunit K [Acidimicrobiia bacterium]|nr:NADH-quinone oxidoreductase subunit K [Acidimicrobiia bacterium]
MIVGLAVLAGLLFAVGTHLVLQRMLSRILIGLAVLGHAANVALLASSGRAGAPPLDGVGADAAADPLPQALMLTAIVITFGVLAFLAALAYRSWALTGSDRVEDDVEDRRIAASGGEVEA